MTLYKVVDNSNPMPKLYYDKAELCDVLLKLIKKYEDKQQWFYVAEETI